LLLLVLLSLCPNVSSAQVVTLESFALKLNAERVAMDLSQDNTELYLVGSLDDGSVYSRMLTVVDVKTRQSINSLLVIRDPGRHFGSVCSNETFGIIAVSHELNAEEQKVFQIDPVTLAIRKFDPGIHPGTCAFSADGSLLYVGTNMRDNESLGLNSPEVSVVNTDLNVLETWEINLSAVLNMATSPVSEKLYVGLQEHINSVQLSAIKPGEPIKVQSLPIKPQCMTFSPDGRNLYICGWNRRPEPQTRYGVVIVDTSTDQIVEFWTDAPYMVGMEFPGTNPSWMYGVGPRGNLWIADVVRKQMFWIGRTTANNDDDVRGFAVIRNSDHDLLVFLQGSELWFVEYPHSQLESNGFATVPSFPSNGVVNAASFENGAVSRGEIISIFGTDLALETQAARSMPLPTVLSATKVEINGMEIPLYFVSSGQINAQVPFEIAGNSAKIQVFADGIGSEEVTVGLTDATPGIFVFDRAKNTGAVIFASGPNAGEIVSDADPAKPGDILAVFATGLGEVRPPLKSGFASTLTLSLTTHDVRVSLGGKDCKILFSGLAPGFVGLYQVNFEVADMGPGKQPLSIGVAGNESKPVTLVIK